MGSPAEREESHAFGMGSGYDTSCMKALRYVKSFVGFSSCFSWENRFFGAHIGTRRRRAMLSSGVTRRQAELFFPLQEIFL
jgi:hypothetical protein